MRDAFARWSDPALTLTVGGVGITIPAPTIRVGLRLKAMYAAVLAGDSAELLDLPALLLPDRDRLAEWLTPLELTHVANTAAAHFGAGPKLAEHVWHSLDPDRDTTLAFEPDEPAQVLGRWGWYDPRPGAYGPDDPGGGDYNPHTGYRAWYRDATPDQATPALTWPQLLDQWDAVVCDFQQHYRVDLDEVADTRSIAWLETRLAGLHEIPDSRVRILTTIAKEAPRVDTA